MPPPETPTPTPPAASGGWPRFGNDLVRLFNAYGQWLARISWLRFLLLSILLLIVSGLLTAMAPSGRALVTVVAEEPPAVPRLPKPPKPPKTPRSADPRGEDVTISIDGSGVRITAGPKAGPAAAAAASATATAAAAAEAAASVASGAAAGSTVEIKLPPWADNEAVREAVKEARESVIEAIREARREAADAAAEAAEAQKKVVRTVRRIESDDHEPPFPQMALLFIIASAIMKITYGGQVRAETKAAVATETAESEQLKRQVAEARMAALQAQIEPHFLFNTLASIDHLIETDPRRASQMQKNLIALLRASMPSLREAESRGHNLGREMAVIRPYLEILKVRMEDRLQTRIDVPDGLLSAEFPPMVIQSLVENAIQHGLEPKAEGGELRLAAEIVHGKLAVTVADTGLGFGKAATAGTGVGLENIRERLKLLYGERAAMVVADNQPSGTVVTLTVPYQAQATGAAAA